MKLERVPLTAILTDPQNPRQVSMDEKTKELCESIRCYGIQVPTIGYQVPEGRMLVEGHRRFFVAPHAGLSEIPMLVYASKPSEAEILTKQLTIGHHRAGLTPIEEFKAFSRLAALNEWNHAQLAAGLAISKSEVTRVMSIGGLSAEELQLIAEGKLSKSGAYALSRMEGEQRKEVAGRIASGEVTRDQLNKEVRAKATKDAGAKVRRIRFVLPGCVITIQTTVPIGLTETIDHSDALGRECRKFRSQGLDISTAVRVLEDRNRAQSAI